MCMLSLMMRPLFLSRQSSKVRMPSISCHRCYGRSFCPGIRRRCECHRLCRSRGHCFRAVPSSSPSFFRASFSCALLWKYHRLAAANPLPLMGAIHTTPGDHLTGQRGNSPSEMLGVTMQRKCHEILPANLWTDAGPSSSPSSSCGAGSPRRFLWLPLPHLRRGRACSERSMSAWSC